MGRKGIERQKAHLDISDVLVFTVGRAAIVVINLIVSLIGLRNSHEINTPLGISVTVFLERIYQGCWRCNSVGRELLTYTEPWVWFPAP